MANWENLKQVINSEVINSGITDIECIKLILKLERRLNTCRNYLTRNSWAAMCYNLKAFDEARSILENLQENYTNEYSKYCNANGYVNNGNIGDMLC
jgi:hypothetical protein